VATTSAQAVRALVEPVVARSGLVVEDVTITPAGRRRVLRVTVDLPETEVGGVAMDTVARAAQDVSAALDEGDVMGGTPYVLEVSSPGADRPLTQRRHWMRARGRLVHVVTRSGEGLEARLIAVDDEGIVVAEGRRLPWAEVVRGRVEVEFGRLNVDDAPDQDMGDDEAGDGAPGPVAGSDIGDDAGREG